MTREEAIERFNGIINAMSISIAQAKFYPSKAELDELCDMAIEALKADVVSREEAIQAIDKCRERKNKEIEQLRELYSQKPTIPTFAESAESYKAWTGEEMGGSRLIDADALKIKIEEELYSNDYEEHIYQIIDNAPTVSADRPTMTEEVREALMRLTMCAREECDMCKYEHNCSFDKQVEMATESMNTIANAFKSADRPHGEHGEWEHTEEVTTMDGLHWHVWRCTNCNSSGNPDMNYCPNCGAKMGGDDE